MVERTKRDRNILIALTPEMLERLRAVAERTGIKSATLAALAIGEMVARLEAPDRAIKATTGAIAEQLRAYLPMAADGTLAAIEADRDGRGAGTAP